MTYRVDSNRDVPYDLSLLYSVPESPGAEKQAHHARPPLAPNRLPTDQQGGQPENVAEHAIANAPWYRTRRGFTAIVIVIILIIGGIIGGAVGGTHHSSPKRFGGSSNSNSSSTYSADDPDSLGIAPSTTPSTYSTSGQPQQSLR